MHTELRPTSTGSTVNLISTTTQPSASRRSDTFSLTTALGVRLARVFCCIRSGDSKLAGEVPPQPPRPRPAVAPLRSWLAQSSRTDPAAIWLCPASSESS